MQQEYTKVISRQDGLQLDTLIIAPKSPKAVLQLVHGMCEHKERYIPFMEFMVGQGYACVIHDHRGHGGSIKEDNDLGYFYENGKEAVVEDIYQVMSEAKQRFGELPYFLMGHSMGSLAVRCFVRKYDNAIDGLIVCGSPSANPMAGVGIGLVRLLQIFKGVRGRSKLVDSMVMGSFEKPFQKEQTKNSWLCSDKTVVENYNADPFCGYSFTLNGYEALLGLMKDTYTKAGWQVAKPELPIHFIAGEKDPCITNTKAFQTAVNFMKDRGYRNVTGKLYQDMRHEILNETCKEQVYADIVRYCENCM